MRSEPVPACKHPKYKTSVVFLHVKMPELNVYQPTLTLKLSCKECGDPYTFRAPHGFSTIHPTANVDLTELRIPVDVPVSEAVDEEEH